MFVYGSVRPILTKDVGQSLGLMLQYNIQNCDEAPSLIAVIPVMGS